jgi:hypothetical protein
LKRKTENRLEKIKEKTNQKKKKTECSIADEKANIILLMGSAQLDPTSPITERRGYASS